MDKGTDKGTDERTDKGIDREPDADAMSTRVPTGRPELLTNTAAYAVGTGADDRAGAVWRLDPPERDLDANVIALPPGGTIEQHVGPALDVLLHVVSGTGELLTEHDTLALVPGAVVWLPRETVREVRAGPNGLRYLSVHQRRHDALTITMRPR